MSELRRVSPEEAEKLIAEGYTYIDVRSVPEFEQGHVPGALNVPLLHAGPGGMSENPEFLSVMERAFDKHEKLLLGCRSGNRSLRAAQMLVRAGFSELTELLTGWEGSRDAFGRPQPGWSKKGLPVETGNPEDQSYEAVKRRASARSAPQ
jgi:rhodanese-related sulfurtransferase